jgi:hypothetical protein
METITVTPAEIIYRRRIAVLEHAARTKNVAATCRTFGISRTRYYQWKKRADAYVRIPDVFVHPFRVNPYARSGRFRTPGRRPLTVRA